MNFTSRARAAGLLTVAVAIVAAVVVNAQKEPRTDLLPAFLLAGIAIGLCAPSLQISALSGVAESSAGIASGLVETMREVGGAAGVAAVSTALVSRTGLAGFHAGFVLIAIVSVVGAVTAAVAFQRRSATAEQHAAVLDFAGEFASVGAPLFDGVRQAS